MILISMRKEGEKKKKEKKKEDNEIRIDDFALRNGVERCL